MYTVKINKRDLNTYKPLIIDEILVRLPIPITQREQVKAELEAKDVPELLDEMRKYVPRKNGRLMPYVLFGFIGLDLQGGVSIPTPRLHRLYCATCHASKSAIDNEIGSGKIILDFWFPTRANIPEKPAQTESGWVLNVRNGDSDYSELARYVKSKIQEAKGISEARAARDEASELRTKLAAAEKQLHETKRRDQASTR